MRRVAATALAAMLATPPVDLASAPVSGTVEGIVTVSGRPLAGVVLALVDLDSGAIHRTRSGRDGGFRLQVTPGDYVISSNGDAGLALGRGPTRLTVAAGTVTPASIDLVPLPVTPAAVRVASLQEAPPASPPPPAEPPAQEPPAQEPPPQEAAPPQEQPPPPPPVVDVAGGGVNIHHESIGCFVAGEFPLIPTDITPPESVARARLYFKAATSDWFFVEMAAKPPTAEFDGRTPRPTLAANPMTYYIQATTTTFGEAQTPEIKAIVVAKKEDCGDRKVAAFGPAGPVQVFSAASGIAIAPAGFAAGGLALTAGTIAIVAGAGALGLGTIIVTRPAPTPTPASTPTPRPTPTPTPVPTPRPTPTPTPTPPPPPPPVVTPIR